MAFGWVNELRKNGIWVEMEYGSKGLKAQMKKADRLGVKSTLIVGDNELEAGKGILREEVKKMLDAIPYIKSYRIGNAGEGGIGVTVVYLKK